MPKKTDNVWSAVNLAGTIGLTMVSTIAVGLMLGRWADGYFATSPWCTIAGIVAGMAAGLWSTYKKIVKL